MVVRGNFSLPPQGPAAVLCPIPRSRGKLQLKPSARDRKRKFWACHSVTNKHWEKLHMLEKKENPSTHSFYHWLLILQDDLAI